jgi:proteic killer suppression protein
MQKACSTERESIRAWGAENARRVRQRLVDLHAFSCLADVPATPPFRCHPLKGRRTGQFAIDLKQPYRLIFEIDHDPVPTLPDGGVDRSRVTALRVLSVEDYHGE